MSEVKTLLALLLFLPLPSQAEDAALYKTFATCAGRYSAELEHAWLMGAPDAAELEQRRQQFVGLIEAVLLDDQQRLALNQRVLAKAAHRQLLTQATFSQDASLRTWALTRARSETAYCRGLLLES